MRDYRKLSDGIDQVHDYIDSRVAKYSSNTKVIRETVPDISLYTDAGIMDIKSLFETPIGKYCMIEIANRQKLRLLKMNLLEKSVTLYKLGDSTSGISNHVSDEVEKYKYNYTENNNYLNDYQLIADKTTTREKRDNNNYQNFHKQGHNSLYGVVENLYYDDNDTGTGKFGSSKKLEYYEANDVKDSLLRKTKQLFRDRKISTIVSRFHTDNENLEYNSNSESARSIYGLSHGRNLLTYDAERNGVSYDTNGYNNPYCRVWTHHHQYSDYRSRLIRPFVAGDAESSDVVNEEDLHSWPEFNDKDYVKQEAYTTSNLLQKDDGSYDYEFIKVQEKHAQYGWKGDEGRRGWKYSVFNKNNGLVNITPKYLGGAEKNIHTKDCMFSIENLAWQGFDPYSFERALSWEQRGPFGGRIMWFPPYGLQFNEDSSVNWNEHSFIGRGESVYTYANTSRSGTLSFMMVVDHPSILDYATWHDPKDLKDTDVLRFFAGCDFGDTTSDGNSNADNSILKSFVKPTPLTDEYYSPSDGVEPIPVTEEKTPEEETPKEKESPSPDEEIKISFYTFFPNNYSGAFDREYGKIDPIAYLLFGKGAQWDCINDDYQEAQILPLTFDELANSGTGYEMTEDSDENGSLENGKNYIIGTVYSNSKTYQPKKDRKWFYRIDGEYKAPITSTEIKNCFAQFLPKYDSKGNATNSVDAGRMKNTSNFKMNSDIDAVAEYFTNIDKDKYYSLSEIAYVLCDINGKNEARDKIKTNSHLIENNERITKLKELLDFKKENNTYKVINIECKGFSNSHGANISKTVNDERNEFLAKERAITVKNWFKKFYNTSFDSTHTFTPSVKDGVEAHNENGPNAKKYRSVLTTITIKKSSVKSTDQMNLPQNNEDNNTLDILSVEDLNGGAVPSGYKPYKYKYIGNNKEMPDFVYTSKEPTYQEIVVIHPGEYENYVISEYAKEIKNIITSSDISDMSVSEWDDIKSNYEPTDYILTYCDPWSNVEENMNLCEMLKNPLNQPNYFGITQPYKEIISKEEWNGLDSETQSLYSVYRYKIKEKTKDEQKSEKGYVRFEGFEEVSKTADGVTLYKNTNETNKEKQNLLWYYDENDKTMKVYSTASRLRNNYNWSSDYHKNDVTPQDKNSLRYDQEYHFFKQLETKHPDVFSSLVEKLQYFDPAFHSMTPEGFMGRLNFLHQCTRQGDTITASDKNGFMANNLAFGRPPFCILRLGDFYYQKIVIRNINITYDPLVLDLNNEGIGVVPLIANVTISFNFIGGGDLTGPVRRLQNAMSFNYYANGRLYDNRADRVERELNKGRNWDTMGAVGHDKIDFDSSYFHNVKMNN